jgi:hypothetical protein
LLLLLASASATDLLTATPAAPPILPNHQADENSSVCSTSPAFVLCMIFFPKTPKPCPYFFVGFVLSGDIVHNW